MIEQLRRVKRSSGSVIGDIRRFLMLAKLQKIKINVGSAGINKDGEWHATDIDTLDLTNTADWKKILLFHRADNIMGEHVWEHLTEADTLLANKNCFKFLKRKGVLRIAVPDGFHPDAEYINYVKPGGHGAGADDHKILYTYITIRERLEKVGFKVELLEYWDENGVFHFTEWTDEGGHIRRSKRFDERNNDGKLNYTSLIVDAIKP